MPRRRPRPQRGVARAAAEGGDGEARPSPGRSRWGAPSLASVVLAGLMSVGSVAGGCGGGSALAVSGGVEAAATAAADGPAVAALRVPERRARVGEGASATGASGRRQLTASERATINLFKQATPGVVYITNLALRQDAFTLNEMEVPQGSGSGFVWDAQGRVVTNFHVIRGATDLRVTVGASIRDQETYEARVVGYDEDKDVAVLQLEGDGLETGRGFRNTLSPLQLGTSTDLLVGQQVYAIGNPFGLDHTLTTGVISGTGREIMSGTTGRPIQDIVQTDAAINPGNSGGPLLDSTGRVIGINTAIYSPSGGSSGVGFAIPVDTVRSVVGQILKYGKVIRPVIGITFAPDAVMEQLGIRGVLVLDTTAGGPAELAGLRPTTRDSFGRLVLGDIIVAIDDQDVRTTKDLFKALDGHQVGDRLQVTVLRGGFTTTQDQGKDTTLTFDVILRAAKTAITP